MKWNKTTNKLPKNNQIVLCWWGNRPEIFKWVETMGYFQNCSLVQYPDAISHWTEIKNPIDN